MSMEQVLIIEDDQRLAQMVCDYLRQFGYSLEHAPNGASGLRQIEKNDHLKLVILDLMLPDMNGAEVIQDAREKYAYKAPAIFLTGMITKKEEVIKSQ